MKTSKNAFFVDKNNSRIKIRASFSYLLFFFYLTFPQLFFNRIIRRSKLQHIRENLKTQSTVSTAKIKNIPLFVS